MPVFSSFFRATPRAFHGHYIFHFLFEDIWFLDYLLRLEDGACCLPLFWYIHSIARWRLTNWSPPYSPTMSHDIMISGTEEMRLCRACFWFSLLSRASLLHLQTYWVYEALRLAAWRFPCIYLLLLQRRHTRILPSLMRYIFWFWWWCLEIYFGHWMMNTAHISMQADIYLIFALKLSHLCPGRAGSAAGHFTTTSETSRFLFARLNALLVIYRAAAASWLDGYHERRKITRPSPVCFLTLYQSCRSHRKM